MRKLLLGIGLLLILISCATEPEYTVSSIYTKATPNRIIQNGDGTTTFEFVFPNKEFNSTMAGQRMSEYFNIYAANRSFASWTVVTADADSLTTKSKSAGAVTALSLIAAASAGYAGKDYTPTALPTDKFVRFIVCIQFSTEESK